MTARFAEDDIPFFGKSGTVVPGHQLRFSVARFRAGAGSAASAGLTHGRR